MNQRIPASVGLKFYFKSKLCIVKEVSALAITVSSEGQQTRLAVGSSVTTVTGRQGVLQYSEDRETARFFLFEENLRAIAISILSSNHETITPKIERVISEFVDGFLYVNRTKRKMNLDVDRKIPDAIASKQQLLTMFDCALQMGPSGMPRSFSLEHLVRRTESRFGDWSVCGLDQGATTTFKSIGLIPTDILILTECDVSCEALEKWAKACANEMGVGYDGDFKESLSSLCVWKEVDFDGHRLEELIGLEFGFVQTLEWYRRRLSGKLLIEWATICETTKQLDEWLEAGFVRPSVAREWMNSGVSEGECKLWYGLDFKGPEEALTWISSGISIDECRLYREIGVDSVSDATRINYFRPNIKTIGQLRDDFGLTIDALESILSSQFSAEHYLIFLQHGISQSLIGQWIETSNVNLPTERQVNWILIGFSPAEASEWEESAGNYELAVLVQARGHTLTDWRQWMEVCDDPSRIEVCLKAGIAKDQIELWISSKAPTALVNSMVQASVDYLMFEKWSFLKDLSPKAVINWESTGLSKTAAQRWIRAGHEDPISVKGWIDLRLGVDQVATLSGFGLSDPDEVRSLRRDQFGGSTDQFLEFLNAAIVAEINVYDVRYWRNWGWSKLTTSTMLALISNPRRLKEWRASSFSVGTWSQWVPAVNGQLRDAELWRDAAYSAQEIHELNRQDEFNVNSVSDWIAAGLTPRDYVNALRHKISEPKEWIIWRNDLGVLGELSASRSADNDKWILTAGGNLPRREIFSQRWESFISTLIQKGYKATSSTGIRLKVSGEWFDEVVGRVNLLQNLLRKVPRWPSVFESNEMRLECVESGNLVLAWVGRGKAGRLVLFDALTLEPKQLINSKDDLRAYGLAISWFLDTSLLLDRQIDLVAEINGVFRPTRDFYSYLDHEKRSPSFEVRACSVAGHLRLLGDGHVPSEEQRALAPAYLRSRMLPQHTYVRPHSRNGQLVYDNVKDHLSKYSATAASIAFASIDF